MTIKRNLISADRKLMLSHLESIRHLEREQITHMIERIFDPLSKKLIGLKTTTERYQNLKKTGSKEFAAFKKAGLHELAVMRQKIIDLRKSISPDMDEWGEFCRFVLRLKRRMALQT